MPDPAMLARLANASARKSLLSFLGPATDTDLSAQSNGHDTVAIPTSADLLRKEREDLNNIWKENAHDSAGVGVAVAPTGKQDSGLSPGKTLNFGRGNSIDEELLRQRVLGKRSRTQANLKSSGNTLASHTKRSHVELGTGPGLGGESSSDEEAGRSRLGKRRGGAASTDGKAKGKGKRTAVEVETFESMQTPIEDEIIKDKSDEKKSDDIILATNVKTGPTRPKSYLDEILEEKQRKKAKKKKKKQKREEGDDNAATANLEDFHDTNVSKGPV